MPTNETQDIISTTLLLILLAVGVVTDLRSGKIPNRLTLPSILVGWGLGLGFAGWAGLKLSLVGTLVGLALLFLPFALRGVGAGDVKFLAGIGALKGSAFVFWGFLYGAIVGGICSMVVLLSRGILGPTLKNIGAYFWGVLITRSPGEFTPSDQKRVKFPYALSLALGCIVALVFYWHTGVRYWIR